MTRYAVVPIVLALVAGCTPLPPPSPAAQASAAASRACRASTDASFQKQNRYLLSERDQTDSPYSTSGDTGITTRGLSQRYGYDVDFSDCIAASRGGNPNGPATSSPPPVGSPVAPY